MFKKNIKINERVYDISIANNNGNLDVQINGKKYGFASKDASSINDDPIAEEVSSLNRVKSKKVKSPLSGTIISVDVKPKDKVKKGQKLLTILAMKMENEVISETEEIIKEVRVSKDQTVNKNDILIVFDE